MPTIFRSMKRAVDDLPVVGSNSKELGVRVPPNQSADIELDEKNYVVCNGCGMSVASNWRHLLAHLIPKRLKPLVAGAAGSNGLTCYKMGAGDFTPCAVTDELELVLKSGQVDSGNVAPNQSVHCDMFQAALAATRTQWSVDES